MKNLLSKLLLTIFVTIMVNGAQAGPPKLSLKLAPEKIAEEIDSMVGQLTEQSTIDSCSNSPLVSSDAQSREVALYFSRVDVTFWPVMTFNVGLFQLNVTPLIRLRFDRKPPSGWTSYRPFR